MVKWRFQCGQCGSHSVHEGGLVGCPVCKHCPGSEEGVPAIAAGKNWPVYSDAAAVHPEQIAEARAEAQARGVPTEFLPDGRVIFKSRAHRREYCRAFGLYDRDGGYGDP